MASAYGCAQELVATWAAGGVREVVLSPGSRSAPLAYALAAADRDGLLRLHVRIDERTAAFLALGLAKGSRVPVVVVTTSGTAAANLHPAVLEASHAHLPLVAVTADRPRELTFTGANQTTDQPGLFARHVRAEAHLDAGADRPGWEATRLLTAATGIRTRRPGPVHLNVAFADPLTPDESPRPAANAPGVAPGSRVDPVRLPGGPRTVVLAGDAPPAVGSAARALAERARLPLLAEPSSGARGGESAIGLYRLLLGTDLAAEVERVVVYGHPTLSRPATRLLAGTAEVVVVSPYPDAPDPGRRAALVADAVDLDPDRTGWLDRWRAADAELRPAVDGLLDIEPVLTGPGLAAAVWSGLGADDVLVAGSSNPVRDLDLAPVSPDPPTVLANRGLSGIDGTVSTAAGVALAYGRPTTALLGDLTLLHDLTGLVIGPGEPRPDLRLVVANDVGGSIFATLEHGRPEHAATFERVFGTPHRVDLEVLATAMGVEYRRVGSTEEVRAAFSGPPRGLELVEAVVDRAGRRALGERLEALSGQR